MLLPVVSLNVFLTLAAQVCSALDAVEEGKRLRVFPCVCPAEPLSPGVSMTGRQPDGTEQVCSR